MPTRQNILRLSLLGAVLVSSLVSSAVYAQSELTSHTLDDILTAQVKPNPAVGDAAATEGQNINDLETELNRQDQGQSSFTGREAEDLADVEPHAEIYLSASAFDQSIADDLKGRLLINPDADLNFNNQAGINLFYQARSFVPFWYNDGVLTKDAISLLHRMSEANYDGLEASDYRVAWRPSQEKLTQIKSVVAREIELSQKVVRYFQDARRGRIDPVEIPGDIGFKLKAIPANKVLATFETSDNLLETLNNANPKFPLFAKLRQSLKLIEMAEDVAEKTRENQAYETEQWDDPVAAIARINEELRAKFIPRETRFINKPDTTPKLTEVTNIFVEPFNRVPIGSTLRFLKHRKADIIANMEMVRWLPHEVGDTYVWVNIPEFLVRVFDTNSKIYQGRVVVGKTKHRTPIFADEMEHIVVNPYWNVPRSIAQNEMLPKIASGRGIGRSFQVISPSGKAVSRSRVPWGRFIRAGYRFRQLPGASNALGTVKFLFPNKFAVYLHDTPSKSLFARAVRAFSHGCVRLAEPWVFAEVMTSLQPNLGFDELLYVKGGSKEEWFDLKRKIPVLMTYFTLTQDDFGRWQDRDDVYGYLGVVRRLLGYS